MKPKSLDGQVASTTPGDARLPVLKVLIGLMGVCVLWLLMVVGVLPSLPFSTLCLATASAGFMLINGRGPKDLLHPVRVFGALWCLCLALASMRVLPLISDWTSLMWSCVLTALVSFIGGFWLASRVVGGRLVSMEPNGVDPEPRGGLVSTRKTLMVAAVCVAAGASVLAYEYHLVGAIPALAENVDAARQTLFGFAGHIEPQFDKLYIKIIHPLTAFPKYGVFLAVIALCQRRSKSRRAVLLGVTLIVVAALALASEGGRGFIVDITITSAALFHYVRRRIRLSEMAAAALALFLFLGLFGALRAKASASAPLFERALSTSRLPEGEFWDGIAFGYGTLTYSFEVFSRLIEDLPTTPRPAGGYLFYAFHRFVPRGNLQALDLDLYSPEMITPTFLGEFYADYGYWGVLFGPLVLGILYGWAYSRGDGQHQVYWIYIRAMLLQMLIYFPYWNQFSHTLTWIFDLFFMYFLVRLLGVARIQTLQPGVPPAVALPIISGRAAESA
jgi:oligosaccharide repeat unit polymerase